MLIEDGGTTAPESLDMVREQVVSITNQAAALQTSAKSFAADAGKGFKIDPEAATTLVMSCHDSLNKLSQLQEYLDKVAQSPPLGTTPGAKVVAPFTAQTATDQHGMQPAIKNLQQTLTDMMQAYKKASTNYEQTEQAVNAAIAAEQRALHAVTPRTALRAE